MKCPTIIGLKFDNKSISGIQRLKTINELSEKLMMIMALGTVANIFIGNRAPEIAFNIYSTDWQTLHDSLNSISIIKKNTIAKEARFQMLDHMNDINQYKFWEAISDGCLYS